MAIIDFILSLAGLFLWLNWRSLRSDPLARTTAASLVGTLKRAETRRLRGWQLLGGLGLLLVVRAVLYWQIGPAADWTPKLDLMIVVLAFRTDIFPSEWLCLGCAMLYSALSFLRVLAVCYCWLLVLVLIHRGGGEAQGLHRGVRTHLGAVVRWPWPVSLALPLVLTALAWVAIHPLLMFFKVTGPVGSWLHLAEQGLLVGSGLYFSLKYFLPPVLLLHLVATYVYVGRSGFWDFVSATARRVLLPLAPVPLRLGVVDFAPVAGVAGILLLLHWVPVHGPACVDWLLHLKPTPVWPA